MFGVSRITVREAPGAIAAPGPPQAFFQRASATASFCGMSLSS